ncbi:MAG: zinc ribbon domain-containing protein [Chloroflexi bacterium]|nr:zinc ribbon domain-containing protein [Chloroflexota bacterium]
MRLARLLSLALTGLALLAAVLVVSPGAVQAQQSAPHFKRLKVSIWPEYDDPRVLVIYQGDFADEVTLPATVRYILPQGTEVHAAAAIDAQGQYLSVVPRIAAGDSPSATVSIDQRSTQIDFYYQTATGAGARGIAYTVRPPGQVDSLQVEIQKPLRSSNFVVSPAATVSFADAQGFQYQRYDYSNVAAGAELPFKISYEKPDAVPSVEPRQSGVAASAGNQYALPLVFAALAAVALGVYFYLRGRPQPRRVPAGAVSRRQGGKRKPALAGAGEGTVSVRLAPRQGAGNEERFCTHCGSKARPEAVFCTVCGKPLKKAN